MGDTLRYTVKKILIGIPTVLALTLILFFLLQLIPGDPISLVIPDQRNVPESKIEEIRKEWGLDKPILIQYFYWISHFLVGDFGKSFVSKQQVSFLIYSRLPYTLQISISSLIIAYLIGIPLGVISALKKGTTLETGMMSFSILLYSTPSYWLGLILMLVFGLYLRWFPISGIQGDWAMVLPTLTLALPSVAFISRLMRTEMVEIMTEDFVRTAWAKGLHTRRVIWWHIFRNALIPVAVMFFMQIPWLIGGAIIVETVFSWPGIGLLLYNAIRRQDYPIAQAIIFFISVFTVISNILSDLISAYLDPRIRVEK